jgi:maltokinase
VKPGESAAVTRRLAPARVGDDAGERPITVDQTNHSVVVGEAVVVKWLRAPAPPPHRGAQLLAHLAEVGFTEMPAFFGVELAGGRVVAIATGYVAGALDGWDWCVDDLTADLDSGAVARSVATARRLGAIAGRLHAALATPSSVLPDPLRRGDTTGEAARGHRLLAEAQRVIDGAARARLAAVADRIAADIAVLETAGEVALQPIHGDLHVGQMLRAGDDIVVTDFDGDPVSVPPGGEPLVDGVERRSPMVDLASLVQSIDHVARIVAKRRPDLAVALGDFIAESTVAVIEGYGELAPVDARALRPLRAIQELHEFVYAATVLPRWRYVPEAAIAALYP